MEGVSATLGNAYEIQEQNYVPRLQGRVSQIWSCHRKFILGISCVRWITSGVLNGLMGSKVDSHFGDQWSFSREGRFFNFWYCKPCVMLIVSTKSRNARGASHQPALMSSCLTTSHTPLLCLLSERRLLFWKCLFVVGREVSWERWESGELGRWKRCMTEVKWQGGKSVWVEWGDKLGRVGEWWGVTVGEVGM